MAFGAPAVRRPLNPLDDPMFQPQEPGVDPRAPVDTSALLAQGEQAFPRTAEADSYAQLDPAQPPAEEAPAPELVPPPAEPPPGFVPPAPGGVVKTETERVVLSPESKAALERSEQLSAQQSTQADTLAGAKKAKTGLDLQAEQDQAVVERDRALAETKVVEAQAFKQEQAQAAYGQATEKAKQQIEVAQKRVDAANAKAGESYWANKSTGFKILQALLTFSSVKSSHTLGEDPNDSPFMRMTREAVARDKEQKMSEVRASKEFLEAARKGPEEARQFLLDARADIDASTGRQLQITLKKAEALSKSRKVDPRLLEANIAAANAETDAGLLETQQALVDRMVQRSAVTNRKVTTTAVPGGATPKGKGGHPLFDLSGNQVGVTDNLKLSNEASEKRAGALDSQKIGTQLAAHIREYGMEIIPGQPKAEREALTNDLVSALIKARSGTAASDKERVVLMSTVMPKLLNQLRSSRDEIAGSVEKFVGREINRYNNYVESSATDPKQARALLTGGQAQVPAATEGGLSGKSQQHLESALTRALKDPKYKALVPGLRAELQRRKGS